MYRRFMKIVCVLSLSMLAIACSQETTQPASASLEQQRTAPTASPVLQTSAESSEPNGGTKGVWRGQIKVDAHAGTTTLNYVGAESGDFVPMRFDPASAVGTAILSVCADDDLCEVDGVMELLDEPPPENASAVGRIVKVDQVRKLPPGEA
jgi:hypothetical protein